MVEQIATIHWSSERDGEGERERKTRRVEG